jgi:hypothetical protein
MDRVIFLGCWLLLALGVMTGLGIGPSSELSQSIRSGFELLSFGGTAVTAVVALVALTSWQTQFRHSEKWKAIKNFQDALDGGDAAHDYLFCAFAMNARNQAAPWHERRIIFTDEFYEKQKVWFAQCSKVNKAWGQIVLLFEAQELALLKDHQAIEGDVDRVVNLVLENFFLVEPSELMQLHYLINACSNRARSESLILLTQTGKLQKSLVR